MKVLVTGASGFLGAALVREFHRLGWKVIAAVRIPSSPNTWLSGIEELVTGSLESAEWGSTLTGVDCIVHCAARAHVKSDETIDQLEAYREVNVVGTMRLAQEGFSAGVQRFVFISSIGVNGKQSIKPFTEADLPNPKDFYALSKLEAEEALMSLSIQSCTEVVIVRPPLVYGPAAPGNFASLVRWVMLGIPLPLGDVYNRRSFVALENLVSLIVLCSDRGRSRAAANQVFVVADGEDVSTTTLLQKVAQAAFRPSRLLPFPELLLRGMLSIVGRSLVAEQLLGNLQIDATKAYTLLNWRPVVTMDQQLVKIFAGKNDFVNSKFLRLVDIFLAGTGLLVLWPIIFLVCLVAWLDTRSPIFRQERVGRNQKSFVLIKFRTMSLGTASVASHLANSAAITRVGAFLRRTKLDELPQLWNVLIGDMSLVGPRPGLFNQHELTQARAAKGIYFARPGITGLAQVNGIDMSTPELLAQTDLQMLRQMNLKNYFKLIFMTVAGKGTGDGVKSL